MWVSLWTCNGRRHVSVGEQRVASAASGAVPRYLLPASGLRGNLERVIYRSPSCRPAARRERGVDLWAVNDEYDRQ